MYCACAYCKCLSTKSMLLPIFRHRATSLRNAAATAESNVHVPKSKGKKDKKLLSFEESEDESGEEGDVCTIRRTENRTNLSAVECEKADEEALTCKAVVINSKNSHAGTGVPSVKSVASSESITVLSNTTTGVKPMEKQKVNGYIIICVCPLCQNDCVVIL